MQDNILQAVDLTKQFNLSKGMFGKPSQSLTAVDHINFSVQRGETFGIVGESGCGKSTTGMMLTGLTQPTSGRIVFENKDISQLSREEMRKERKNIQIVFQDPYSSLNPRLKIAEIIAEPMKIHKLGTAKEINKRVDQLLDQVGIPKSGKVRFPHEFSGGQCQRIVLARALSLNPKLMILDEPVSALDVSVQSQIINLLKDLQKEHSLTYVFIAHGMNVVEYMSNRVAVMYLGSIVELTESKAIYASPLHPYTQALFSAIPTICDEIKIKPVKLEGDIPSPVNRPSGCAFHTRCPIGKDICRLQKPELIEVRPGHQVACHLVERQEKCFQTNQ